MKRTFGKYIYVLAAVFIVLLVSCKDDMYDNSPNEPLKISQTKVTVGEKSTTIYISIYSRYDAWELSEVPEWCAISPASGDRGMTQKVTLEFAPNIETEAETRTATLTVTAGSVQKTIEIEQLDVELANPNDDPDKSLNKRIHEEYLKKWYYNSKAVGGLADYNNNYKSFFESYLIFRDDNTLDGKSWEDKQAAKEMKIPERYLYSHIERKPAAKASLVPLNFGMEFELINGSTYSANDIVARILYVMKGSPAEKAGLKRGDWFNEVNGITMQNYIRNNLKAQYNERIDSLVNPIEGVSPVLTMLNFRSSMGTLHHSGNTVTITPERYHGSPILYSNSLTGPIGLIKKTPDETPTFTGYLVYNGFDPAFRQELIDEFGRFKNQQLTHFILDLRYSKTGTVEMAKLMADLLVPEAARGKIFARYEFGDNAPQKNIEALFEPHANSLGMSTVFILTSKFTSGAAELLINALTGIPDIVKTIVVGGATEGMNIGMVKQQLIDDDGEWAYDMWISAFRCYNDLGLSNYQGGFIPNDYIIDELDRSNSKWREGGAWGWKGTKDAAEDPLLRGALEYVVGVRAWPDQADVRVGNKAETRRGYIRQFSVPANMTINY